MTEEWAAATTETELEAFAFFNRQRAMNQLSRNRSNGRP